MVGGAAGGEKGNNTMPLGRGRHADADWQKAEQRGGRGKKKSCLRKRTGAGLASSDAPRRGDTVGGVISSGRNRSWAIPHCGRQRGWSWRRAGCGRRFRQ